jgi:hypothetical protein
MRLPNCAQGYSAEVPIASRGPMDPASAILSEMAVEIMSSIIRRLYGLVIAAVQPAQPEELLAEMSGLCR